MIWVSIVTILSWAVAILMLTGRGSFLIAGYNTSGKEGRELAKKEYDIPGITRYLGKMVMLPIAVIMSVIHVIGLTGLIDLDSMNTIGAQGLSVFIGLIVTFGAFGYIMFILHQITAGKFKK